MILLVKFEIRNSDGRDFLNFRPLKEYVAGKLQDFARADELEYGTIAIYDRYSTHNWKDYFSHSEYAFVTLKNDDIQIETKQNFYGQERRKYFVELDALLETHPIQTLSTYGIYKIVEAETKTVDFLNDNIFVKENFIPKNRYMDKVVLFLNGEYYGPFKPEIREIDSKSYAKVCIKDRNYFIPKIIEPESDDFIVELEDDDFLFIPDLKYTEIDVINDETLIKAACDMLSRREGQEEKKLVAAGNKIRMLEKFLLDTCATSELFSNARQQRIKSIFSSVEQMNSNINLLSETLQVILASHDEKTNAVINRLIQETDFTARIQSFSIITDKIHEEEKKLDTLKQEYNALLNDAEQVKGTYEKDFAAQNQQSQETLQALLNEIKEKQVLLDEVKQELGLAMEIKNLNAKAAAAKAEYDTWSKATNELKRESESAIKRVKESVASFTFDAELAKMIQDGLSASLQTEQKATSERMLKSLLNEEICMVNQNSDTVIVENLVKEIQKYRPMYSRNMILNILISITQNYITIFSGPPGSGKTSICKILAKVIGLDTKVYKPINGINTERFVEVPVERGWTSKRDFVGYYNPLSQQIEKTNKDLHDALQILNIEGANSKYPLFVLLDEANLSPMEYYWSDFIGISDSFDNGKLNKLQLGGDVRLCLPETLRFLATINNDHTVEKLSPRLIDRANIITLPTHTGIPSKALSDNDEEYDIISYATIKRILGKQNGEMLKESGRVFDGLLEQLKAAKIDINPRTIENIRSYCVVAQDIFETEKNVDKSIIALDYAVLQRILSKINGNGKEYRERLESIANYCAANNLSKSAETIGQIINKNNNEFTQYYNFFA